MLSQISSARNMESSLNFDWMVTLAIGKRVNTSSAFPILTKCSADRIVVAFAIGANGVATPLPQSYHDPKKTAGRLYFL